MKTIVIFAPNPVCSACNGKGRLPGDLVPDPFGCGLIHEPDQFCDCVLDQLPDDSEDYEIELHYTFE